MMNFKEFLAAQEGVLLPTRLAASGLSKINPFPTTNAHRKRLQPKVVRPAPPVKSFVSTVPQVVPPQFVAKLKTVWPNPKN